MSANSIVLGREERAQACELVALEAQLLDAQEWDAWLALYREDAEFWVPTWVDEDRLGSDPAMQVSFMYLQGRALLAERVQRVRSGRSIASTPVPRTAHLVAGSLAIPVLAGEREVAGAAESSPRIIVRSAFSSHVYLHKDAQVVTYAGRYEHELAWEGDSLGIARKKIVLINDQLVSRVDFFYL
jgi:benzoate/toluate 1,2-dioxygenase beta subunit/2,4,5-trichlorophenoxyacetic acid oxygenase 2